jgi:hypothetical protein
VKRTDIRNLHVTEDSFHRYAAGNYPAFFEFYTSFLDIIEDKGEVSKHLVALEILSNLFAQKHASIDVEELISMLPMKWQGHVVPVPFVVLETLMVPYAEYAKMPEGTTLGQAWGLEGKATTGQRRSARNLKALKKDLFVALEIEQLYHLDKLAGVSAAIEDLIQEVAIRRGESESGTRKAYKRFKFHARDYLRRLGLFSET